MRTIHFVFTGDGICIPDSVWAVEEAVLNTHPNSLLCHLVQERWIESPNDGMDASTPIRSNPLDSESPCSENWANSCEGMVELIDRAYKRRTELEEQLFLPHGVELEDAVATLEYYGLPIVDPNLVDLSACGQGAELRGRLFLANLEACQASKNFILDHLTQKPRMSSHFLFLHRNHDFGYIQKHNSIPYIKVNPRVSCDACFEMVQCRRFRDRLVSQLEETELEACYVYNTIDIAGPHRSHEYDSREVKTEIFQVLKITIAQPLKKRQRLSERSLA